MVMLFQYDLNIINGTKNKQAFNQDEQFHALTICLAKHDMIFPFLHTILFDFSGR
jgi:hypothetical protein